MWAAAAAAGRHWCKRRYRADEVLRPSVYSNSPLVPLLSFGAAQRTNTLGHKSSQQGGQRLSMSTATQRWQALERRQPSGLSFQDHWHQLRLRGRNYPMRRDSRQWQAGPQRMGPLPTHIVPAGDVTGEGPTKALKGCPPAPTPMPAPMLLLLLCRYQVAPGPLI